MQLQLIRNATLLLDYAGKRLLIDPYFAPKHSRPSYTGKSPNPLVDLPVSTDKILTGVEMVLVSHLHSDHFDPVAQQLVPKDLPLLCQPEDDPIIREYGFARVMPLEQSVTWQGIQIIRTDGHHGTGEVEKIMGRVSGFVFSARGEPTMYWAGDTILCDEVRNVIAEYQPDLIITHSCGATWANSAGERELIVMDTTQTIEVCRLARMVIATHMEALDHATVSRADLRIAAQQAGITDSQLCIPFDSEKLQL